MRLLIMILFMALPGMAQSVLLPDMAFGRELAGAARGGGQSSHERLPEAFERLQLVYRCLRVYLGCARSYKPIGPGMVLP